MKLIKMAQAIFHMMTKSAEFCAQSCILMEFIPKRDGGRRTPIKKTNICGFPLQKAPCGGLFQWMLHAAPPASDASAGGADCMEALPDDTTSMIWAVIHCVPLFQ